MNNKIISTGELAVGQFVTVLNWKPIIIEEPTFGSFGETTGIQTRTHNDNSYKGEILEIKAVDLPFVVVKRVCYSGNSFALDTRRVNLMELSEEYVKALVPGVN